MKKLYNTPEMCVTAVSVEDIIVTSLTELYDITKDPHAQDRTDW